MAEIVSNLRMFNRKERFFLVGMALGNPDFKLGEEFRKEIGEAFRLNVPQDAFVAMDYHLDWIYATLSSFFNPTTGGVYPNVDNMISATQEDIDLLVAYQDEKVCHLIMLEAKGVIGFTNRQLHRKVQRLSVFFGNQGNRWPSVVPHFAIVSPKEPKRVDSTSWPAWFKPGGMLPWIKMDIPSKLKKITRCDENGQVSAAGNYWKIAP